MKEQRKEYTDRGVPLPTSLSKVFRIASPANRVQIRADQATMEVERNRFRRKRKDLETGAMGSRRKDLGNIGTTGTGYIYTGAPGLGKTLTGSNVNGTAFEHPLTATISVAT